MEIPWVIINGIVRPGHQVASGLATDSPYPRGSIEMQTPFFRKLGLDLAPFFPGTLNVSVAPYTFIFKSPEFTFSNLKWSSSNPPETFSFSRCRLKFNAQAYDGLVYYPHPETKIRHFQDPSILEILAPLIADITYGSAIQIAVNSAEIEIRG